MDPVAWINPKEIFRYRPALEDFSACYHFIPSSRPCRFFLYFRSAKLKSERRRVKKERKCLFLILKSAFIRDLYPYRWVQCFWVLKNPLINLFFRFLLRLSRRGEKKRKRKRRNRNFFILARLWVFAVVVDVWDANRQRRKANFNTMFWLTKLSGLALLTTSECGAVLFFIQLSTGEEQPALPTCLRMLMSRWNIFCVHCR